MLFPYSGIFESHRFNMPVFSVFVNVVAAVVVYLFMCLIEFFTNIPQKGTMRVDEIS